MTTTIHPWTQALADYLATPAGKRHYKRAYAEGRDSWADELAEDPTYIGNVRGDALNGPLLHVEKKLGITGPFMFADSTQLEDSRVPHRVAITKDPAKLAAFLDPILRNAWAMGGHPQG